MPESRTMEPSSNPGTYDPVRLISSPTAKGARIPERLPEKFSAPVHMPTFSAGAHDCRIVIRLPVESPTSAAPIRNATAMGVEDACTAGKSSSPLMKARVTMPLRVHVSFHPRRIRQSAIHPPIGSDTPKVKNTSEL